MKIDIKTMLSILAATAVLGGFFYTTQLRLDDLEEEIEEIRTEIKKVRKIANRRDKE